MATRWLEQRRVAVCWAARTGRDLYVPCALAALAVLCGCAQRPAHGDDGVPATAASATKSHKQTEKIAILAQGENAHLEDFCLTPDGQVLGLVGGIAAAAPSGEQPQVDSPSGTAEVRVFDRDGMAVRKWPVDFAAQAINVGPDGTVYVGGNGRVAKFSTTGEPLTATEAPQVKLLKNPDELKERAREQLEAEKASIEEQLEQLEAQAKRLAEQQAKSAEPASDGKKRPKRIQLNNALAPHIEMLRQQKNRTVDQVVQMLTARLKTVNSIAVGSSDLFIACPGTKGYGYSVWRTDLDFKEPEEIITGLSGCCGQMDIQTRDGEVFVAENSRHRIARFDREGKRLESFGSRDRDGAGEGFGGCCNPMNLCFTAGGDLLAAESNGLVKQFTLDGKFVGLVGVAGVPEGCKNSAIGMSSDGDRVYYIDIRGSNVIMLARQDSNATDKEK